MNLMMVATIVRVAHVLFYQNSNDIFDGHHRWIQLVYIECDGLIDVFKVYSLCLTKPSSFQKEAKLTYGTKRNLSENKEGKICSFYITIAILTIFIGFILFIRFINDLFHSNLTTKDVIVLTNFITSCI